MAWTRPVASPRLAATPAPGWRAPAAALPEIVADPSGHDARSRAPYGAWLCGACLGATTMGLHHKLCQVLGGTFDLPNAETRAVVLPHVRPSTRRRFPRHWRRCAGRSMSRVRYGSCTSWVSVLASRDRSPTWA
ncbi:iron-containing alcohol dehydrogenase [Streptomyces sp. NPDC057253]|uniref:iron-containing alcohol dehydrogenase n=1 Tax=Streptomyces sp. NPDC057253 TaxID=3346069 RepID=UPI003641F594